MEKKRKNTKKRGPAQGRPAVAPQKKLRKSRCPVSADCGGCTMIDVSYETQLIGKQEKIMDLIGQYGPVEEIIRMKNPDHYRHKVTSVFAPDRRGRAVCGIYKEHSHEVVPVKSCLIENTTADRIVQTIYSLLPSFRIRVYDEDRESGYLRYVQVRVARVTHQVMVTLVATGPTFPSRNNFVKELVRLHPQITTIVLNINDRHTTMVLGEREIVLYGKGYIEDELCGRRFRLSSRSFFQVNPLQTEKLYNIAIDMAGMTKKSTALDAYCGIGTIGICAAKTAGRVIGVELNGDAAQDALINVRANGLQDVVEIYNEDAGEFLTQMAEAGKEKLDVIFMDPPRSGATEQFLDAAVRMQPGKIVYISCEPTTLARDLEILTQKGYEMTKAVPVDMFPYTRNIEVAVALYNRNAGKKQ